MAEDREPVKEPVSVVRATEWPCSLNLRQFLAQALPSHPVSLAQQLRGDPTESELPS